MTAARPVAAAAAVRPEACARRRRLPRLHEPRRGRGRFCEVCRFDFGVDTRGDKLPGWQLRVETDPALDGERDADTPAERTARTDPLRRPGAPRRPPRRPARHPSRARPRRSRRVAPAPEAPALRRRRGRQLHDLASTNGTQVNGAHPCAGRAPRPCATATRSPSGAGRASCSGPARDPLMKTVGTVRPASTVSTPQRIRARRRPRGAPRGGLLRPHLRDAGAPARDRPPPARRDRARTSSPPTPCAPSSPSSTPSPRWS